MANSAPSNKPQSAFTSWLLEGHVKEIEGPHEREHQHHQQPWYKVMCLTGVDYFSTLGYQPGIAALAAGALSPVATLILVLLTLFGALPMYKRVAEQSPHGVGSISMLENLLTWWPGKLFVLCLIGFAATDAIIMITLSAADASAHIIENPFAPAAFKGQSILITLVLIALLGGVFLIGASLLVFPKLALGLSGFETGVVVMPLVEGDPKDTDENPKGRIRNTHKLLTTAALIMSVLLLASSFVTTVLIPPEAFRAATAGQHAGEVNGRALAYLAHKLLGDGFGTAYDASTILILWFAGSSAMAGLLNIVPRYLPRYGMAPDWTKAPHPLVIIFTTICFGITLYFRAGVDAQAGAYATGVLALMTSATVAVTLYAWRQRWMAATVGFGITTLIYHREQAAGAHPGARIEGAGAAPRRAHSAWGPHPVSGGGSYRPKRVRGHAQGAGDRDRRLSGA